MHFIEYTLRRDITAPGSHRLTEQVHRSLLAHQMGRSLFEFPAVPAGDCKYRIPQTVWDPVALLLPVGRLVGHLEDKSCWINGL